MLFGCFDMFLAHPATLQSYKCYLVASHMHIDPRQGWRFSIAIHHIFDSSVCNITQLGPHWGLKKKVFSRVTVIERCTLF
jgi:hypothetical protein